MLSLLKVYTLIAVSLLVPLYTSLVIQNLWNWFLAEVLHSATMSFWQALGLVMIVKLLIHRRSEGHDENRKQEPSLESVPKMSRDQLAYRLFKETHGEFPKTAQEQITAIREFREALKRPTVDPADTAEERETFKREEGKPEPEFRVLSRLLEIFEEPIDEVIGGTIALGIGWIVHTFFV